LEKIIHNTHNDLTYRKPTLNDGLAIYQLIKSSPPLDLNSSYLYFLQASHFADTCVVVEKDKQIVGFLSGYLQPDKPTTLFVWQVAVSEKVRGLGLGKAMLHALLKNQPQDSAITEIACTISPSNKASQGLFQSLAKTYKLELVTTPFITELHFGLEGHEAEDLYTLRAPNNIKLIPYLS
jgi:L-2,4-diaminobutyric acid acetyltransferase